MANDLRQITALAISLDGDNVDTDRIIPAQYVVAGLTFDGIENWVFAGDRAAAVRDGVAHPFDRHPKPAETILIVGANFGCGSSREHAPQALARWGVRAIIGQSFGEIFFRNCNNIGVLCCCPDITDKREIELWARAPVDGTYVTLNVQDQVLIYPSGSLAVTIPKAVKDRVLSGRSDVLDDMMEAQVTVPKIESRLPYITGW